MARNKALVFSLAAGVVVISLIYVVGFRNSGDSSVPPVTKPEVKEPSGAPATRLSPAPDRAAKPEARRSDPSRASEAENDPLRRVLLDKYGRRSTKHEDEAEGPRGEQEHPVLPPASWSSLPAEYVAGILREQLIPVAMGCYKDLAVKGGEGVTTFNVVVIGDSEVGGVVEEVTVKGAETSLEGELNECVRHAVYDMEFDPPEEGQGAQEFDFAIKFVIPEDLDQSRPPPS